MPDLRDLTVRLRDRRHPERTNPAVWRRYRLSHVRELRRRVRMASSASAGLFFVSGLVLVVRYPNSASANVVANTIPGIILLMLAWLAAGVSTRGVATLAVLFPVVVSLGMVGTIFAEPATVGAASASLGIIAISAPVLLDWDTRTSRRWATAYTVGIAVLVLTTGLGALTVNERVDLVSLVAGCSVIGVLAASLVHGLRLGSIAQEHELRRLNRVLYEYATTDPLTELRNRRQLDGDIAIIWPTIRLGGESCAVLMFDLDNFKRVNDERGHAAGDMTLRSVAVELERQVRGRDSVYRVGGEEFLVLLRDTTLEGGLEVAERIRHAIWNLALPGSGGAEPTRLTISCGVSVANDIAQSWQAVAAAADAALYKAKVHGRDRVFGPAGAFALQA